MTGRTYLLIETEDAHRYERLCEFFSEAQRQYVKVILRGRREPVDFRRMFEVNAMLRDELELIDRQCKDFLNAAGYEIESKRVDGGLLEYRFVTPCHVTSQDK